MSSLYHHPHFHVGRWHWRPDYILQLGMTEILKTYQKLIFNWPESLQESVPDLFPRMLSKKRPAAAISPHGTDIPNRSVIFHSLFFCLSSVQGQGCSRQKHWIPWGKGDKIIARRKAQVHTSPEKLKHMLNFNFLMLKFPLLRRPANKQSHLLQFYKCCIPTVLYCQEIKWN